LAVFKGSTSKGKEGEEGGEGREEEKKGKGRRREEERRGGEGEEKGRKGGKEICRTNVKLLPMRLLCTCAARSAADCVPGCVCLFLYLRKEDISKTNLWIFAQNLWQILLTY